ncbi:MAG: HesA/MoeB/ThiF family protein [Actinobacteria bacterium]|nr:HesA/MoeB/ThiF family protein [Actinomycetota bacterium]MCG2818538.1 HesA/MoeB/ThiF family protein [Actinomycetes bacterium]MBU4179383.1 HesA/MoeB/ThiF family protein [Actinomycetota bacterium]MBU4218273.1 HesA/MoeB/ThiF family protein [Actinomycetota bacterium]MBU4358698.1 HesA/MoeB/ThiF family protein [Actinomycetota bacterium]
MKRDLARAIRDAARNRREGDTDYLCLSLNAVRELASEFNSSTAAVSVHALENGFVPERYLKNAGTIGLEGQAALLGSTVLVVGAGGIGGHVVELLARLGVGRIDVADPDVFDETNLNRQVFAGEDVLGLPKVDVARDRVRAINSDVSISPIRLEVGRDNIAELLEGKDVVIDALDNLDDRLMLQEACRLHGVVMVHGAIAGSCLQATTVFPGDPGLTVFTPASGGEGKARGIEVEMGAPAATPAISAAVQVQEVLNVLLGRTPALRGRMLYIDLEDWTVEFFDLDEH